MRISGGRARGVRLKVPPGARPASEKVRQAIFSSLGPRVDGARVLDLYCGSGAYALEALSRGAGSAVGVDSDAKAVAAARANAEAAGLDSDATFVKRDASAYTGSDARRRGPFDLVFADPPYEKTDPVGLLAALRDALAPDAVVVVEQRFRAGEPAVPSGYILVADRRYGDTRVLTYRLGEE
jgi:16S rRNA (guanine966-N2)-methyltransferase